MKKNKGFTLIELLAIIVILAIIAVITVPIILNIIENAKKGTATDSAYGFKEAVSKWYVSELYENKNLELNGEYDVEDGKLNGENLPTSGITIPIDGTIPTSGTLKYENNVFKSGCLTMNEYSVTFNADGTTKTEKGECQFEQFGFKSLNDTEITIGRKGHEVTGKNVYLKYELTDGVVDINTVPEACLYYEASPKKELCLKNNEFEESKTKMAEFFGYNINTWIPDESISGRYYKDSSKTTRCTFKNEFADCQDPDYGAFSLNTGLVYTYSYQPQYRCTIEPNGTASCSTE